MPPPIRHSRPFIVISHLAGDKPCARRYLSIFFQIVATNPALRHITYRSLKDEEPRRIRAVKTKRHGAVRRQLSTLFNVGAIRELTDGQLLERFSTDRGEVAELAFEALVERHGAMVLRVCRAQLADPHDTQDAFQATFLILVKKAPGLWVQDSLGPWLHQVAFRTAACARASAARRRRHEQRAAQNAANVVIHEDRAGSELERVLHEEINRLPNCYRIPIVLCDLEACSCEEAARRMGCPVGTVKSWRFRGRQRLRERLIRLGLAPSVALAATIAAGAAHAAVPECIVRDATRALSEWMTAGEVSASARMLVKGVLRTMIIGKLRMTAAAFFAVVFLTAGLGAIAWGVADDSKKASGPAPSDAGRATHAGQSAPVSPKFGDAQEQWSLTLHEALNIGLDNSEIVRVIARTEKTSKIAVLEGGTDPERFKSEIMAHLRSVEQLYWNLSQARVHLWAADRAVELGKEILKRERAGQNAGNLNAANILEVEQRLEQFNLDLVTRTSDVITTERQLRNILGLRPADNRRIIPVTAPTEALVDPDWNESLATMLEKQPDIVRQRSLMKQTASDGSGQNSALVERQKAYLKQLIHQTTHSLARFFLEIDSNHKQLVTVSRARKAANARLESQQAYYSEGRITVDRLMDAVGQWATLVAQEAQYKSTYNISIVALEEAKGTLLDYKQIEIVEGPNALSAEGHVRDRGVSRASVMPELVPQPPAQILPVGPPPPTPVSPTATAPQEAKPNAGAGGKTIAFQFTIGTGSRPIEVRGSFTITPAPPVEAANGP
jgi:RNA polymerase sigma factor (sigma-70 family)